MSTGIGLPRAVEQRCYQGDELYAIECDGVTQGLMTIDILKKRCQIESQLRRRLVYIRALTTAPWNRPAIRNPPTYKGLVET
jgi:hypothetical protein